jgi:uncharacterized protein (DUF1330 family)
MVAFFQSVRGGTYARLLIATDRLVSVAVIALALASGIATAFAQAQTPGVASAPAYYVAEFELTDPDGIKPYSANVTATFEPFGGRFIARGGRIAALEGAAPGSRTVIIRFPSMERAQAWYNSPAYEQLRPFRQRSGVSRTYIINGLPE